MSSFLLPTYHTASTYIEKLRVFKIKGQNSNVTPLDIEIKFLAQP